jgi:polyhydroxybutyrate depolymerase
MGVRFERGHGVPTLRDDSRGRRAAETRVRRAVSAAGAALLVAAALAGSAASAGELKEVSKVEGVQVKPGTSLAGALDQLPKTAKLALDDGKSVDVPLSWSLSEYVIAQRGKNVVKQTYLPSIRGSYEVTGTFALPEGVTRPRADVPLEVTALVTVTGAPLLKLDDKQAFSQPGKYATRSMRFGEIERTYHTYVPSTYTGKDPVPVMFTFHGGGSYAIGQLGYSEFDAVAEREGFIVVAPDYGLSALGRFASPGVAEFTSAIIDEISKQYNVDASRIYASGISMGGSASFTLAHELGDRIAAVAPVASSARGLLERKLPRPTTIVWFYGTEDSGYGSDIYATLDHLVAQNGGPRVAEVKVWTPTEADPTGITRFTYGGGPAGAEIVFYRIDQGGHTWPGKYQYSSLISVGLTSQHIDASQVIWDHLKNHRLPSFRKRE